MIKRPDSADWPLRRYVIIIVVLFFLHIQLYVFRTRIRVVDRAIGIICSSARYFPLPPTGAAANISHVYHVDEARVLNEPVTLFTIVFRNGIRVQVCYASYPHQRSPSTTHAPGRPICLLTFRAASVCEHKSSDPSTHVSEAYDKTTIRRHDVYLMVGKRGRLRTKKNCGFMRVNSDVKSVGACEKCARDLVRP